MAMSWFFLGIFAISFLFSGLSGNLTTLTGALIQGSQEGITVAFSLAGSLCLWTGFGKVMERSGLTARLAALLRPVLDRLFPTFSKNPQFAQALSANVCANLFGLGNAATPAGIQAAKCLAKGCVQGVASHELCRLVVLNTASIQLIPTTVASLRTAAGCQTPLDILPAVWLTSICALSTGLLAACFFKRICKK